MVKLGTATGDSERNLFFRPHCHGRRCQYGCEGFRRARDVISKYGILAEPVSLHYNPQRTCEGGWLPVSDQERCPIFPSMLKAYCSHCQGTARGSPGNPNFSLKEGTYSGFPVVEVLRDGAAIHPWDDHFRFGRRKAEILLACIDLLRDFWKTNGDEHDRFVPQVIENGRHRLRVRVFVEKHPDFERSDGQMVERSWLRLQALPPDDEHIGLGAMKCRAICELQEELTAWLAKRAR